MDKFIADFLDGRIRQIAYILFILSASSALFTYGGASLDATTFQHKARATVFAIAGGSAIYLFWTVMMHVAPRLVHIRDKATILILIFTGCTVIFWLSSAFNVAGLAGRDALEKHLSEYVTNLEDALDMEFRKALLIEGASADIRSEIVRYYQAAYNEMNAGAYSGHPGTGAVHTALSAIGRRFEALQLEADAYLENANRLRGDAQARLETIRKIQSADRPLSVRMEFIAKESDALRADLARMDVTNLAGSVRRTLDALPREVDMQSSFSTNAQTAKRQRAAVEKVRTDIAFSGSKLSTFLHEATQNQPSPDLAFKRITAVRAVMIYWPNYIPYWAGGIALDIAPLAVVLAIMIAVGGKTKEEMAAIRILNKRIGDVVDAKLGEEITRSARGEMDFIKAIMKHMQGKDTHTDQRSGEDKQ